MLVAHALRAEGFDASEDGTGRGTPIVPVVAPCLTQNYGKQPDSSDTSAGPMLVAFGWNKSASQTLRVDEHVTDALQSSSSSNPAIAFSCKDHGAEAFQQNCRHEVRLINGDGSIAGAHASEPGMQQQNFIASSAVRRLTPKECERLQGFPDVKNEVTIRVCPDASFAEPGFLQAENPVSQNAPVAVSALIDLERGTLLLRNHDGSVLYAGPADERSSFPLPTGIESFARLAALTTQTWVKATRGGAAASRPSINDSSPPTNGNAIVRLSGQEIESAADAAGDLAAARDTFIISGVGLSSQTLERTMRTLSSCVVRAIASFIPSPIREATSYDVRLSTIQGYTAVPYCKKPAADGPRYRALGNSMAVPVMSWIGERIEAVNQLVTSP